MSLSKFRAIATHTDDLYGPGFVQGSGTCRLKISADHRSTIDALYLDIRQLSTDIARDSATSFRFDRNGLDLANYHLLSREIEQRYRHRVHVSVLEDNISPTLSAANSPVMPAADGSFVPSSETSSLAPISNNNNASVALQDPPVFKSATVVDAFTLTETIPQSGSTDGMSEMYVPEHHGLVGKQNDTWLPPRREWFRKKFYAGCVVLLVLLAIFPRPFVFVFGGWTRGLALWLLCCSPSRLD